MTGISHTFVKAEKLTNHKLIGDLFAKKGKSIVRQPLLFAFIETSLESTFPAQILISVGKRKFKKSPDRNRLRRLIREAYRLEKHRLYAHLTSQEKQIAIGLIYLSKDEQSFTEIHHQLTLLIDEYIKRY